jgi:hypothetical protein
MDSRPAASGRSLAASGRRPASSQQPFPIHCKYQGLRFVNMVDDKIQQTIYKSPAKCEFHYAYELQE